MREQVWWLCCGGSLKVNASLSRGDKSYGQLVDEINGLEIDAESGVRKTKIAMEVEKDLRRTFPNNSHFESEQGIDSLRTLLICYGIRNPTVGYCQSMNFLAAFLLLNMDEERAFWTLASIVEDILPKDYYTSHMVGSRTDQRVLLSCLKWKLPSLHRHFVNIGVAPEDGHDVPLLEPLTCTWYLCIFVNSLPLASSLRVWDCFMHEGKKVLLRVGLSILKICQPELMKCEDLCGVYEVLRNNRCVVSANSGGGNGAGRDNSVVLDMVTASELIDMSYDKSWIGGFPHDRIDGLRREHQAIVVAEAAAMEKKRADREVERKKREEKNAAAAAKAKEEEEQEGEQGGDRDCGGGAGGGAGGDSGGARDGGAGGDGGGGEEQPRVSAGGDSSKGDDDSEAGSVPVNLLRSVSIGGGALTTTGGGDESPLVAHAARRSSLLAFVNAGGGGGGGGGN